MASCFACVLFSYLVIEKLGDSGVAVVTGLDYPTSASASAGATKKKRDNAFSSTKSQVVPVLRVDNYRYASENETDTNYDREISTSQLHDMQGKGESNLISDDTNNSTEITTRRHKGSGFSYLVALLQKRFWNRLDAMDKMIVGSTLPLLGLTSIVPLVTSADLFWVNQLGDTLAVSAQSAANTVYQFSFGLFSFLPSVTATLVSKNYANNDWERTQDIVCRAFVFALMVSSVISMTLFTNPSRYLGAVLKGKTRLKKDHN